MTETSVPQPSREFKILVVDDSPTNLKVIGHMLNRENFKVSIADSGMRAIETAKKISPDLILLDIMMPGMDGLEACGILKSDPLTSEIPVIFLTAKAQKEDVIAGFHAGGVDYVTKPFHQEEVLARINSQIALKEAKDALIRKNMELEQINSMKDKFFSIIAHDLKNPIGALSSSTQYLTEYKDDLSKEELDDFVQVMDEAARSALSLLENLLEWGRVQTRRISFTPEYVYLHPATASLMALMDLHAKKKQIKLISEVPEEFEIYADKHMLETVLRNLLSNAIKFTPEGGAVTLCAVPGAEKISVIVKDTGIGMDDGTIQKLFRIDTHISSKGTASETGTGLGLILCHEFVRRHEGTIQVFSEEGKGTTFTVTLPVVAQ